MNNINLLQQQQINKLRETSNFFEQQPDRESQMIYAALQCLIGSILAGSIENLSEILNEFLKTELSRIDIVRKSESN